MTSKSSFWVSSKENHKRRIWVWIVSILLQMMIYPGVMVVYLSRVHYWDEIGSYQTRDAYLQQLRQAASDAIAFREYNIFIILFLGVLISMQGFSYLYDRRKVDLYQSVPVSAKTRFWYIYKNGILMYTLPYLCSVVIAFLIASAQGAVNGVVTGRVVITVFCHLMLYLTIYNGAILILMVMGNYILAGGGILLFLFSEITVVNLLDSMKYAYFKRADGCFTGVHTWITPLNDYLKYCDKWRIEEKIPVVLGEFLPLACKWLFVAAVLLGLSYYCYKKRPMESAGKALAFDFLKPIVKVFVSVAFGIGVGYMVYEQAYYNSAMTIAVTVTGTLLSCGVMEVVYEFDIRAMIRHLASTVTACVLALAVFIIFKFDVFGYDAYIPKADNVESVAVYTERGYMQYFDEADGYVVDTDFLAKNMYLTDVDAVLELAKKTPPVADEQDANTEGMELMGMRVLYRLRSGREVSRFFYVDLNDASNEPLLNRIIGSEEYRDAYFQIAMAPEYLSRKDLQIQYTNGTVNLSLAPQEAEKLRDVWLEDMQKYDYSLIRHEKPCGYLHFTFYKNYNTWELPVYDTFTKTIQYLEEKNVFYPVKLDLEDVATVTVTNYNYVEGKDPVYVLEPAMAVDEEIYAVSADRTVTETFNDPEQVQEILDVMYPSNLYLYWTPDELMDSNYSITITFKEGTDYPYDVGYYTYELPKDMVPDFVAAKTTYVGE